MDPSIYATKRYNSFLKPKPVFDSETMLPPSAPTSSKYLKVSKINEVYSSEEDNQKHLTQYVQKELYDEIVSKVITNDQENVLSYGFDIFEFFDPKTNLFMLFANVDAVYKLTGFYGGLVKQRIENPNFTYFIMNDEFMDLTRYMQFRVANSKGIVYNTNPFIDELDDILEDISTTYLTLIKENKNKSILQNQNKIMSLFDYVNLDEGVDLVLGVTRSALDIRVENRKQFQYYTSIILLQYLIMTLKTCKKDGNFMGVIYDTTSELSGDIIYLYSQCFESVYLMKPMASYPVDGEKVLIALTRKKDEIIQPYLSRLEEITLSSNKEKLQRLLSPSSIPSSFKEYLTKLNNEFFQNEKVMWEKIETQSIHKDIYVFDPKIYDTFNKTQYIWSLY